MSRNANPEPRAITPVAIPFAHPASVGSISGGLGQSLRAVAKWRSLMTSELVTVEGLSPADILAGIVG